MSKNQILHFSLALYSSHVLTSFVKAEDWDSTETMEHLCRLYVCTFFNHSGFLAVGANKRATFEKKKKNPQEILSCFPKLNSRVRPWFCRCVYACVYLFLKPFFHHKSSEVAIWLVFCHESSFWKIYDECFEYEKLPEALRQVDGRKIPRQAWLEVLPEVPHPAGSGGFSPRGWTDRCYRREGSGTPNGNCNDGHLNFYQGHRGQSQLTFVLTRVNKGEHLCECKTFLAKWKIENFKPHW